MSSSSASGIIPDKTELLLGLINELTPIVNKAGLFLVFGSSAIHLRKGIALNPSSDIDCMLLLNGYVQLEVIIAQILVFIHLYYLRIFANTSNIVKLDEIIEINVRESAPEQINICRNIMSLLKKIKTFYRTFDFTEIKSPSSYIWIAESLKEYVPIKLKVIYEMDGRYLIKLLETV